MKIRISDHLRMLKELFIVTFITIVFFLFFTKGLPIRSFFSIILLLIFYFFLFILPVILIHSNYFERNRSRIYFLSNEGISINCNETKHFFNIKDFEEINFYLTPQKNNNSGISFLPYMDYYYCEIVLKDEKKIYLTCLLDEKLKEIVSDLYGNLKIKNVITLFPLIKTD